MIRGEPVDSGRLYIESCYLSAQCQTAHARGKLLVCVYESTILMSLTVRERGEREIRLLSNVNIGFLKTTNNKSEFNFFLDCLCTYLVGLSVEDDQTDEDNFFLIAAKKGTIKAGRGQVKHT